MQKVFGVQEVADILGVKSITVYRLVRSGELGHFRVGNRIRVTEGELQRFIEEGSKQ